MPTGAAPRRVQEIFAATLDLLTEHGYDGLTIEAIAQRAGVHKTTLYRWWSSKDELLAAAVTGSALLDFPIADTGSLRGDLLAVATRLSRLLTRPATAAVLAAVPGRPLLAEATSAFFTGRLTRDHPVFTRAVERGELAADGDADLVVDLLAGALWFHLLLCGGSADRRYLARLVDSVLTGVSVRRA
ncbi:TetR/AcrR family transcriptional regulator [Amycolatopsis tucumanensis]|uniref:TetR/AcrR family transcriptional regulator n=1 Tax=Amycolatopsis tucumanensis TaxID=401106 RepID=UPI003D73A6B1